MVEHKTFKEITAYLLSLIPKEEIEKLKNNIGDCCAEFMGFVDIYYHLSQIVPKYYTIIDFGAAYNTQNYFSQKIRST